MKNMFVLAIIMCFGLLFVSCNPNPNNSVPDVNDTDIISTDLIQLHDYSLGGVSVILFTSLFITEV